jgi:hypothetical protein
MHKPAPMGVMEVVEVILSSGEIRISGLSYTFDITKMYWQKTAKVVAEIIHRDEAARISSLTFPWEQSPGMKKQEKRK